jgi:hypothetical protein
MGHFQTSFAEATGFADPLSPIAGGVNRGAMVTAAKRDCDPDKTLVRMRAAGCRAAPGQSC